MTKLLIFSLTIVILANILVITVFSFVETSPIVVSLDATCGSRAVQYIIRRLQNKQEDLIDLVREIQGADPDRGATLEAIEQALRKRGIYTSVIFTERPMHIRWDYPIIIHIKSYKDKIGLGHYLVRVPGVDAKQCVVWDGLSGYRETRAAAVELGSTGYVLVSSPKPFSQQDIKIEKANIFERKTTVAIAVVSLLALMSLLYRNSLGRLCLEKPGIQNHQAEKIKT